MTIHHHIEFRLTQSDRNALQSFLHSGVAPVRVTTRARVLLMLDEGFSMYDVESCQPTSHDTAWRIGLRYNEEGLDAALFERPRPGAARLLDESQVQRFAAMICAAPPEGKPRWTVRMAAEEAVKRGICRSMARETARVLMKEHDLKPWREKNVVHSQSGQRLRRAHGGCD